MWSAPYLGTLGNSDVHLAFLTYPPEGATVDVTFMDGPDNIGVSTIPIPAGSAPFVLNVSCVDCYVPREEVTVFAAYAGDPPSTASISPESLAVTSVQVVDAILAIVPATVRVSLTGLAAGVEYSIALWCRSDVAYGSLLATSQDGGTTFTAMPGTCRSSRYMVVSSKDQVHVAGIRASQSRQR